MTRCAGAGESCRYLSRDVTRLTDSRRQNRCGAIEDQADRAVERLVIDRLRHRAHRLRFGFDHLFRKLSDRLIHPSRWILATPPLKSTLAEHLNQGWAKWNTAL